MDWNMNFARRISLLRLKKKFMFQSIIKRIKNLKESYEKRRKNKVGNSLSSGGLFSDESMPGRAAATRRNS